MSIEDLIQEKGHKEAISQVMFGDSNEDINDIDAETTRRNLEGVKKFLKGYKGKRPYIGFMMENVVDYDLNIFINYNIDYKYFDKRMLEIKKELESENQESENQESENRESNT